MPSGRTLLSIKLGREGPTDSCLVLQLEGKPPKEFLIESIEWKVLSSILYLLKDIGEMD